MVSPQNRYDVIVVGGGHAGSEAAGAAARMGARTLMVTMNLEAIAKMSCNPAMGGVAKGQLVREIDALGGLSGLVSDQTGVQFRMLNRSKGPAMWSPRCQSDRAQYAIKMREMLESRESLYFRQDNVVELIIDESSIKISGVVTKKGKEINARTDVLITGTLSTRISHMR